ncbi:MAG: peptidylprolyl isomerase [Clostridium perfringens]|nr:peptidylprolyl isomerase [Clostridium perfringens]
MKKILRFKNLLVIIIAISVSTIALVGCTGNLKTDKNISSSEKVITSDEDEGDNVDTVAKEDLPVATMTIKDYGTIKIELYPHIAENTVNNFISLANNEFYNGLIFHRVIEDFMIQGGDPTGTGTSGPGYSIEGEFSANGIKNSLKHEDGVISMARSSSYNSAGSQFFIMTSTANSLDGNYAAFGKVIEGLDIIYKIQSVETDSNDKPLEDIVIESITIDTKGVKYADPIKIN